MKSLTKQASFVKPFLFIILVANLYLIFSKYLKNKPTVYKYFEIVPGNNKGLEISAKSFTLNGKTLLITSGVIHYFRLHPKYWRDSLRKLRASGAIAVQTSVPWNLHEPLKDVFDFGNAGFEMSPFLDILHFIQLSKEEDLLVIMGLGPYINGQLDFGGLPSYLVNEGVKVRSSDNSFLVRVEKYFNYLLPLLEPLQALNGGPIIMFQVENSYGSIQEPDIDNKYIPLLKNIVIKNNIHSLLFSSDSIAALDDSSGFNGDILQTTTAEFDVLAQLETLETMQANRPLLVLVRSGIPDTWDIASHIKSPPHELAETIKEALNYPASVSIYMFQGGTSFNFLSGAALGELPENYHPYTTSFDFDAPITEAGDYTEKYWRVMELFRQAQHHLWHPTPPPVRVRSLKLSVPLTLELRWPDIVRQLPAGVEGASSFVTLDDMPGSGKWQNFGYVHYAFNFRVFKRKLKLKFSGLKRDMATVLIDQCLAQTGRIEETKRFWFWNSEDQLDVSVRPGVRRLEVLVENCGRLSHSRRLDWLGAHKGLNLDNKLFMQFAVPVGKLNVSRVPFTATWVASLDGWIDRVRSGEKISPSLVSGTFSLTPEQITDTFMDVRGWGKGLVFVNGFNIGRYFSDSPQQALYIPAPLLRVGHNVIVVFEQYCNPSAIQLTPEPIFN